MSLSRPMEDFKLALLNQNSYALTNLWLDENSTLRDEIKALNQEESEELLYRVMCSSKTGYSIFITLYLSWLNDASLIAAVLKRIQSYNNNQISVLENSLKQLAQTEVQHDSLSPINPTVLDLPEKTEGIDDSIVALVLNTGSANSLKEALAKFRKVLPKRNSKKTQAILNKFPLILRWFSSQPTNFGTDHDPRMRIISFEELRSYFEAILTSQATRIFKDFWQASLLLRNYYKGEVVNFGTEENPDIRQISSSKLIKDFAKVLRSHTFYMIADFWDNSPLLQEYYSGQEANFGTLLQPNVQVISFEELLANFKAALSARNQYIIKAIWDKNSSLRTYYNVCSFNELDTCFKLALSTHYSYIIVAMWNNSPLLQSYYTQQSTNNNEEILQTISLKERLANFKAVLDSHCLELIEIVKGKVPDLWQEFCGRHPNFVADQALDPSTCEGLIDNFKCILSANLQTLIHDMWDDNLVLHNAIRNLPRDESKLLLGRVINCIKGRGNVFITEYLAWFKQDEIIKEVLSEMRDEQKLSALKRAKIGLLEAYFNKNTDFTESRKRKTSDQIESDKTKKQKPSDVELNDILIKLPENLQKNNKCYVPHDLGEKLKTLSQSKRKEIGLISVRKTKSADFTVQLNPDAYYAARKKHLIPVERFDVGNNDLDAIFEEVTENIYYKDRNSLLFFNDSTEKPSDELYIPLSPRPPSPTQREDD